MERIDGPDLPLLDGEDPDIRVEARKMLRPGWMTAENAVLGGKTPNQIIHDGHGARVRDLLRRIKRGEKFVNRLTDKP